MIPRKHPYPIEKLAARLLATLSALAAIAAVVGIEWRFIQAIKTGQHPTGFLGEVVGAAGCAITLILGVAAVILVGAAVQETAKWAMWALSTPTAGEAEAEWEGMEP